MQLLKSFTSLSEFASNPHYCEKIIGSDSSPGYMCKVKSPQWENVALAMNHQKTNLRLYWINGITYRLEDINQLRITLVLHTNFPVLLCRKLSCYWQHSALCQLFLLTDESSPSPQEPGRARPRLLLFGHAEVCASCSLHCVGNRSALPSLHMERLFTQITVRVHAPAADCRSLPLLQHHGAKPRLR